MVELINKQILLYIIMCGIIAYIGKKQALPILINGLKRLEYRGYDSAGVAIMESGNVKILRAVGKISV